MKFHNRRYLYQPNGLELILDHKATNYPTDRGHPSTMAIRAKYLLVVKRLAAVAEMGHYDGQAVKSCAGWG